MTRTIASMSSAAALALALAGCGGSGGTHVNPIPSPTPAPTPTGSAITIFQNPATGTFASQGVSASVTGSGALMKVGAVSSAAAEQVHIRYTGQYYEIQMPHQDWDVLTFAKGVVPADPANSNLFQPQSAPQNGATLATEIARTQGYQYSELSSWIDPDRSSVGALAFGMPTPAGQIPITGQASYAGIVRGQTDIVTFDSFDGYYRVPVTGTVKLDFNFGSGSLGGAMDLALADTSSIPLGTFTFKDTTFGVGHTSYSGAFQASASGQNFFNGQFTGPNAQETIGAWALPFVFKAGSSSLPADNQTHQAFGAWTAKKGP